MDDYTKLHEVLGRIIPESLWTIHDISHTPELIALAANFKRPIRIVLDTDGHNDVALSTVQVGWKSADYFVPLGDERASKLLPMVDSDEDDVYLVNEDNDEYTLCMLLSGS